MASRRRARAHSGRVSGGKPRDTSIFPQFAEIDAGGGASPSAAAVLTEGHNIPVDTDESTVDLGRVAWMVTVVACLIAVLVLILDGYYGYAGVTLAVAISAGINLL
jgi:hypothetical protein